MKISEVIKKLQEIQKKHGDIESYVSLDADSVSSFIEFKVVGDKSRIELYIE